MLLLTVLASFGDTLSGFFDSVGFWLLAIGGIGLVVFVHELGHFLVAKKCGVRVEAFSIGFGPRIFGFRRGDTDYRLSLVPIGGYVKMAGDNPGDALQGDGSDLPSKSVGQRFAIFAAGVVMNLLFALIVLPIVLAVGVQFHSTRVGSVQLGGAAWKAGVAKDDEIVRVDGHHVDDFNDVVAEVALSGADGIEIELVRPATERSADGGLPATRKLAAHPDFDPTLGRYVIGIGPALAATFEVTPGGPAERAGIKATDQVIRFGDHALASSDDFEPLRIENREPRVTLGLLGVDGTTRDVVVEPSLAPEPSCVVGIKPFQNHVKALRGRAALEHVLQPRDELLALEWDEGNGATALRAIGDGDDLAAALAEVPGAPTIATLIVRRDGLTTRTPLLPGSGRELAADIALTLDPSSCRVRLVDGFPAQLAGLPDGAEITKVGSVAVTSWADIKQRIEKAAPTAPGAAAKPIEFVARVDGKEMTWSVTPRVEQPPVDFGLLPTIAMVERSYPFVEAVSVGISSAGYMIKNVYLTLKKILVREVSASNLSGILTIAYVSRSFAESGIATLFFFLAVLSLNLAFLNVLPIPVLDGGHLFFLLVEKVKGSPVSEKVMGFSQLVGMVLVLALLLFVTYNDLRRFFV